MLIGTFLLILGWGIPRKSLWHRYWNTLYISMILNYHLTTETVMLAYLWSQPLSTV